MKISACYMVRNEEKTLLQSLQSVSKAADEIIVVDTGSTDRTKEIALSFQAKVYDFPWQDDFSAPRNFALSKGTGDWIVFLDADEYFSPAAAHRLRSVIQKYHEAGWRGCLLLHRYDIDADNADEILADTLVARIFTNNAGYRYQGIIHEELLENGQPVDNLAVVDAGELSLMHTGYRASLSEAKARRNLELLLRELATTDKPERLYMYLADAYLGLGEKAKAKHYAELDVSLGRRHTTYASRAYRILLQLSLEDGDSLLDRLTLCRRAVQDFPEQPEFRADLAECLAAMGDYEKAAAEMEQALQSYEHYQGIEPMLLTPQQAEQAAQRMQSWKERIQIKTQDNIAKPAKAMNAIMSPMEEIAILLQMLLYPLLLMSDEEYKHTEAAASLPAGFIRVLQRYHGGTEPLDDTCSREYLDALSLLLTRQQDKAVEKLLNAAGDFSAEIRGQAIACIDKRIKEVEMRDGVEP